jgi:hypothetical protein
MLRGYSTVLVVDESRSSPSSPRALSPARATLEPLNRLDRTPVISKHVHDLSNNFFVWTGACQLQSLTCIIGYTVHPGPPRPFARSPLLSALAVPARKRSTGVYGVVIPPTGDLVPFKWQASLATSACRFQSARRPHLPALSSACCSRRGKRPIRGLIGLPATK